MALPPPWNETCWLMRLTDEFDRILRNVCKNKIYSRNLTGFGVYSKVYYNDNRRHFLPISKTACKHLLELGLTPLEKECLRHMAYFNYDLKRLTASCSNLENFWRVTMLSRFETNNRALEF